MGAAEVGIHRTTGMQDGLVFVLENPTDRTHAFAAYGLFEEITGAHGDIATKLLRVNVTSEDRARVQISTAQFQRGRTDPRRRPIRSSALCTRETRMWGERSMSYRNNGFEQGMGSRGSFWRTTMKNRRCRVSRLLLAPMVRWRQCVSLVSLLVLGLTWALSAHRVAHGSEFRFVVEDLPDSSAAWLPGEVVIHMGTDLTGGLTFLLANPTTRTHVFWAEGLYEQAVGENGEISAKPLRVTVAPEDSVRTVVSIAQWQGSQGRGAVETFRFFCPLHKGDADSGGTIHMVHHGGTIRTVP